MATHYPHLLQPGHIGSLRLRNRIVVTAMGVNLAEADGRCGERIRAYHEEQAKGGAGLIILGVSGVGWPLGSNQPGQVAISDDRFIKGLSQLAEAVHAYGSKIAAQLHFGGLVGVEDLKAGRPVWAPSMPQAGDGGDFMAGLLPGELEQTGFGKIKEFSVKVMTLDDIQQMVQMFAAAAERAKRAGMDGVEIHGGHGYIISSFLSPVTNQRSDEYGGNLENRARLLLEIIDAVRLAVGPDFPVWCKLDSQEFGQAQGITLEHAIATARLAQAAGVDAITATSYHDPGQGALHSGSHTPDTPELMVANAAAIKAALGIPVIASGRIEPEAAEQHIGAGRFDFLAMGRKLLADPQLPRKLAEGRAAEVRPCIYCYCCISQIYIERPVKCAVNPEIGFERERQLQPVEAQKHVVVIGGGPAGMESARRLALRGHRVTLLEQTDRLGGTLQFAALAYEPNERILNWLRQQVSAAGVDIRYKTLATPELLQELKADEVIVATGAVRALPGIPGVERENVFSGDDLRQLILGTGLAALDGKVGWATRLAARIGAMSGVTRNIGFIREATRRWMPLGQRIVIIGGELVGLELAEFLALRGRKVTVIDTAERFGAGLHIVRRLRVLDELRKLGITLRPEASDIAIDAGAVRFTDASGDSQAVAVDHVIVAQGASGDVSLAEELRAAGFFVRTAGDCNGVGYIEGAMESAAKLAIEI